jgi:hypothetical protein
VKEHSIGHQPNWPEELRMFQAEAEQVLAVKQRQ